VTPPAELTASLVALVGEYDDYWSALDVAGLTDLWERGAPESIHEPIYIGDEYAMPLIGADQVDRHWARLGSRLKRATVSSRLWSADALGGDVVRCVLLSRWSFTGRESDVPHTGASWITWLLAARGGKYRIFHHVESQVYLEDGFPAGPGDGPDDEPEEKNV
jgi:hypothetical protein